MEELATFIRVSTAFCFVWVVSGATPSGQVPSCRGVQESQWEIVKQKCWLLLVEILVAALCVATLVLYISLLGKKEALLQYKEKIVKLRKEKGDTSRRILVLRTDLENSEKDRLALVDSVKGCKESQAEMEKELAASKGLEKQCALMANELHQLYFSNKEKAKKIKEVEMKLSETEGWQKEKEEMMGRINDLTETCSQQEKDLEQMNTIKKTAEEQSHAQESEKIQLVASLKHGEEKCKEYETQVQVWKERCLIVEQEKENICKRHKDLSAWALTAYDESKKMVEKLGSKSAEVEAKNAELEAARKELEAKSAELESTGVELETARKNIGLVNATLQSAISENFEIQNAIQSATQERGELKEALVVREKNIVEKSCQIQEGEEVAEALWAVLEKESGLVVELMEARGELERKLQVRVNEAHRLKGALVEAKETIEELQNMKGESNKGKQETVLGEKQNHQQEIQQQRIITNPEESQIGKKNTVASKQESSTRAVLNRSPVKTTIDADSDKENLEGP